MQVHHQQVAQSTSIEMCTEILEEMPEKKRLVSAESPPVTLWLHHNIWDSPGIYCYSCPYLSFLSLPRSIFLSSSDYYRWLMLRSTTALPFLHSFSKISPVLPQPGAYPPVLYSIYLDFSQGHCPPQFNTAFHFTVYILDVVYLYSLAWT